MIVKAFSPFSGLKPFVIMEPGPAGGERKRGARWGGTRGLSGGVGALGSVSALRRAGGVLA